MATNEEVKEELKSLVKEAQDLIETLMDAERSGSFHFD